jgi:hypothetical protein
MDSSGGQSKWTFRENWYNVDGESFTFGIFHGYDKPATDSEEYAQREKGEPHAFQMLYPSEYSFETVWFATMHDSFFRTSAPSVGRRSTIVLRDFHSGFSAFLLDCHSNDAEHLCSTLQQFESKLRNLHHQGPIAAAKLGTIASACDLIAWKALSSLWPLVKGTKCFLCDEVLGVTDHLEGEEGKELSEELHEQVDAEVPADEDVDLPDNVENLQPDPEDFDPDFSSNVELQPDLRDSEPPSGTTTLGQGANIFDCPSPGPHSPAASDSPPHSPLRATSPEQDDLNPDDLSPARPDQVRPEPDDETDLPWSSGGQAERDAQHLVDELEAAYRAGELQGLKTMAKQVEDQGLLVCSTIFWGGAKNASAYEMIRACLSFERKGPFVLLDWSTGIEHETEVANCCRLVCMSNDRSTPDIFTWTPKFIGEASNRSTIERQIRVWKAGISDYFLLELHADPVSINFMPKSKGALNSFLLEFENSTDAKGAQRKGAIICGSGVRITRTVDRRKKLKGIRGVALPEVLPTSTKAKAVALEQVGDYLGWPIERLVAHKHMCADGEFVLSEKSIRLSPLPVALSLESINNFFSDYIHVRPTKLLLDNASHNPLSPLQARTEVTYIAEFDEQLESYSPFYYVKQAMVWSGEEIENNRVTFQRLRQDSPGEHHQHLSIVLLITKM